MGKKYRAKICAYCGKEPSTTGDHVFAREFFLVKHRDGLPQVPACAVCNGEKSKLEHYLTAVLPFGARHPDATVNLQTMVPKRLERNAKLRSHLAQGYTGDQLPLDCTAIEGLFAFIAKGLAWHHWRVVFGPADCAAATVIRAPGLAHIGRALSAFPHGGHVEQNLGAGTFIYEGLQIRDNPLSALSFWAFAIYGGLQFGGDPKVPDGGHSHIFAVTGPRAILPHFWANVFGEHLDRAS